MLAKGQLHEKYRSAETDLDRKVPDSSILTAQIETGTHRRPTRPCVTTQVLLEEVIDRNRQRVKERVTDRESHTDRQTDRDRS